ncbi:adenosine 3'-phospho 5'-phosphosulfate transporter 2 [Onthophagus taurus]|uniref:adenosine 3'-phospho 5'-phosphosulfate transporter 2 n=1 Tax=Onthophagus taurus TaxID=166361 RepID=UPI0039BE2809
MSVNVQINTDDRQLENNKIAILWFDITHYSQTTQFISCSVAVFFFYILYGYMQELIFTLEGFSPYGWFLTLVQFGFYTIFGFLENIGSLSNRRIPIKTYLLLALLTLGTMGFSNASLGYLNYPTQVIFKCCKLIPVLIGSILIQGKRYGPLDFSAAIFMSVGLAWFILADSKVYPNFNSNGVLMISMALLCDAVIGNVQEKSMKKLKASSAEVVFYSYGIGFLYIFFIMCLTGELINGIQFFGKHPMETYGYGFIFSITGYLGIQVVLTLVKTSGAFAAVTVTTCRKAVTMILSFLFFSRPFTFQYVWSGLLVVLGIYINLYSKKNPMSLSDIDNKLMLLIRYFKMKFCTKRYTGQYLANI